MTLIPTSWMLPTLLAAVLLGDVALSIKPCLLYTSDAATICSV